MSYQSILGYTVLTALALLIVAVVCFVIAVMIRAYRSSGKKL